MKMFILAVVLIFTGFSEATQNCSLSIPVACEVGYKPPLPETQEEWDAACDLVIGYLECAAEHEKRCLNNNEGTVERIRQVLTFAREEACNNESGLYRAVADNIQCVKEVLLKENECDRNYNDDAKMIEYGISLREQGMENIALDGRNTVFCITQLYLYACRAVLIDKNCGDEAKLALIEIFKNVIYTVNDCEELIIDDLPTILRTLEREGFEDAELEKVFKIQK